MVQFTTLGRSNTKISQIGLGTWQFGSKGWGYDRDFNKTDAINIVHRALELGINLIDTAEVYAMGESERIIGQALKGYEREEVVIVSKFLPAALRPSAIKRALTKSLKRLQTDYLDVYLIHWPNPLLSTRRTIKALDELVDEGKIRYIGVSNFSIGRLKKAQELTKHEIVSNQVSYSLANLKVEEKLLPYVSNSIDYLEVPESNPLLNPILDVIPLQLLSYYLSVDKGINPDLPRNLSKTLTVD